MDVSGFPESMKVYFTKPYQRTLISGSDIEGICGSPKVKLENYDVYTMGKRKGSKDPIFWTKMRILGREFQRSVLQGYLKVQLISGYGYENYIKKRGLDRNDSAITILRPADLIPLVTDDGAVFKKRSVIDLGNSRYMSLEHVESFCILPLMTSREVMSEDVDDSRRTKDRANCRKRKAYAMKARRGNRELLHGDTYKNMYKMVLRYKKQFPNHEFVDEFMRDVNSISAKIHTEFCGDSNVNFRPLLTLRSSEKTAEPDVQSCDTIKISEVDARRLDKIPMSKIKW